MIYINPRKLIYIINYTNIIYIIHIYNLYNFKMSTNKEKGTLYEIYINNYLNEFSENQSWLWENVPEYELRQSGILGDWNIRRYERKSNKINGLPDIGTDILLKKHLENKYILVQCKNYAKKNSVQLDCLAGFFGMLYFYDLDGMLFYTSKISKHILCNNTKRIQFIKKDMDEDLNNNNTITLDKRLIENPYYYQIDAYEKLKNENRSILSLPCGLGKTLVSIMISKDYDNIIIISPLIAYAKQNLDRYNNELNLIGYNGLLVNSEGTRDENDIIRFIKKYNKTILSFTYDSVDVLLKIINNLTNFIIVLDEFHNLSKNDIIESENQNTPIYDILHSEHKILFMSATPKFFQFESSEDINDKIFGKVNYTFSMSKAIQEKHICDYEIYLPDLRIETTLSEISEEVSIIEFDKNLTIKGKFLLRGMLETGSRKCIVYLRNQEEAIQMMEILNKLNEYYAVNLFTGLIISDTNYLDRTNIINDFSNFNGYSIICSVKILNECIDIPKCDSIYMTYKTDSKILIIQRLCRANRKNINDKNKISKIFLWCDEYNDIGFFISQLKEYDETFIENKVLIMNSNENDGGIITRNIKDNNKIYEELDNIIVNIRKFGYGIDAWNKNLNKIKEYIQINNKLPSIKINDQKYLAHWVHDQRHHYLNNIDIMRLPEIRDIWNNFITEYNHLFQDTNTIWNNHLLKLENFINNNNRLPSQSAKYNSSDDEDENDDISISDEINEYKLAKWMSRNNEQFNKKIKCMSNEETRLSWTNFKDKYGKYFYVKLDEWFMKMNNIIDFIKTNNRLPVETKEKPDECNLRVWFRTQQKIYDRDRFKDDINKKNAIEKLYTDYSNLFNVESNLDLWINKYQQFIAYIDTHKRLPPEKYTSSSSSSIKDENELSRLKSLGIWKSNCVQNAKVNFSTVVIDIDPSKLTKTEQTKYETRLKKYQDELTKDNLILSKTYSTLSSKDKKEYDKIKQKRENIEKKFDEERFEANEKNRLWNEAKLKYPSLF